MTRSWSRPTGLALACALALGPLAPVRAQTGPSERIEFGAGRSSATRKGRIRGYAVHDYVLSASAGQTMTVELASSSRFLSFSVLDRKTGAALATDPAPVEATEWSGVLPESGDYVVRVFLVRAEARRNHTAPFTLSVSIAAAPR